MSHPSHHHIITDWNFQNLICESIQESVQFSTLHSNLIQIICEFAYNIRITRWSSHAEIFDFFVMQRLEQIYQQQIIDKFLENESKIYQEFSEEIIFASNNQFHANHGCLMSAMYTFNSHQMFQLDATAYTRSIYATTPVCRDWNLQHLICQTLHNVHTQSSLNYNIIQIICDYAFNIHLDTWTIYAAKYDQFILKFHTPNNFNLQSHIEEQLINQTYPEREFLTQSLQIDFIYNDYLYGSATDILDFPWKHCWVSRTWYPSSILSEPPTIQYVQHNY